MNQEFKFLPAAVKRATIVACWRVFIFTLAIALVFVYLFWAERSYPEDIKRYHIYLLMIFPFFAIGMVTGKRKETKESLLILSPEGIRFNKRPVILFSDIGKIEHFSSNLFFIYNRDLKPIMSILNLERQEEFLSAVAPYTKTGKLEKVPFITTLGFMLLTNFIVTILLLLQIMSDSKLVIAISGIGLIALAGYILKAYVDYRKQNSQPNKRYFLMVILILLIACTVLIRLIIIGLSYF